MSTPKQVREVVAICGKALIETFMAHREVLRTPCLECVFFHEESETCTLVNPPQRPPARVIAFGCAQWKEAPPF